MELSRRNFIAAGAAAAVGLVAMGGCSPAQNNADGESKKLDAAEEKFDSEETVDVVVVGSGSAGTSAASRAAELGMKTLCLEKGTFLGGTSTVAEYMNGVDSRISIENGLKADKNEIFNKIMAYGDYGPSQDVVWSWINNSGAAMDWMEDSAGIEFTWLGLPGEACVTGAVNGEYAHNGDSFLAPLRAMAEATGNAEFRTECPARSLVVEGGKVCGVIAEAADGSKIKINAKAVVLAAGGFSSNKEMYERYMGRPYDDITFFGFEGRDGDSINMVETAGFVPRKNAMSSLSYTFGCIKGTHSMGDDLNVFFSWVPLLTVNGEGRRFMNEAITYDIDQAPRNIMAATAKNVYQIADADYIKSCIDQGAYFWGTDVTSGDFQSALDAAEFVYSADTVEELAKLIGADPDELKASIDAYNAAGKGAEDELGMQAELVTPVETAPFYAAKFMPSAYCTIGGMISNAQMQLLDNDLKPIEGVYIAGTDNGSLYYRDYPMAEVHALIQSFCFTSGKIAAEDIKGRYM